MNQLKEKTIRNWLCYYGNTFGFEAYSRFDLVALDGRYHPPLVRRKDGGPIFLGYVSIGEVEEGGHLWPEVKGRPYIVRKNSRWNSWIVDVRDSRWQAFFHDRIVPEVLGEGFDGLFVDTIDSSLGLLLWGDEQGRFAGTREALRDMIFRIRRTFPDRYIAINRGLPILPDIAGAVDFVVVEGLYSQYGGPEKGYVRVEDRTRDLLLEQIGEARREKGGLTVLTLDYAGTGRSSLSREAISFSRKKGFIPYVGNSTLDQVFYDTLGNGDSDIGPPHDDGSSGSLGTCEKRGLGPL